MSQWIGNGLQGWAEELLARDFETLLVDEPLEQVLRITLNRPMRLTRCAVTNFFRFFIRWRSIAIVSGA